MFGENITVSGLSSADVAVGDRFEIGTCLLEATSARIPCAVFQEHLGEQNWVSRFREARRPGVYCRVVNEGVVSPGDLVNHVAGDHTLSILDTQDLYYDRSTPADVLRSALAAPIAQRSRANIEGRLERLKENFESI